VTLAGASETLDRLDEIDSPCGPGLHVTLPADARKAHARVRPGRAQVRAWFATQGGRALDMQPFDCV